jgi:predicted DNA-binding ribbon-helix-helix protein
MSLQVALSSPLMLKMDPKAMTSLTVKRSFVIADRKKSISLEEVVWRSLKEIAARLDVTLLALLTNIASTKYQGSLSSEIRLFVLNFYREQLELQHRHNNIQAAHRSHIQALH